MAAIVCLVLAVCSPALEAAGLEYDPLLATDHGVDSVELVLADENREREIPLKVYLPDGDQPAPVVLFSHGLGGSRNGARYLGEHLAARGYLAVFVQHPGSDESVWKGRFEGRMRAMRQAASPKNLVLRCQDVKVVLDQFSDWHAKAGHPLSGRICLDRIGMSGHSFGAQTTQAIAGQSLPLVGQKFFDERIDAAIAYSPSSPLNNGSKSFANVSVPWMLMTGTKDVVPIGRQTVETRRQVFTALPKSIDRFELVLYEAQHSVFGGRTTRSTNPNHHQVILALTTAFWDAYLKNDERARVWLTGEEARQLLEPNDQWQWLSKREVD
ncbi:MAG: dienelactone hydrolase family protein [Planctomycetales bacterium]|nr:dienelactone hydrolase family protein [Planctomycetales bacterium]